MHYFEFDKLGMPKSVFEEGNKETQFFWDKTNLLASITTKKFVRIAENSNATNSVDRYTIDGRSVFSTPCVDAVVVSYNERNEISSITKGINNTEYYHYDAFGRLDSVFNYKHELISAHDYHIQDDGYNYVRTTTPLDQYNRSSYATVQFYDGIGRPTLSATNAIKGQDNYIYQLKEYDGLGRLSRDWNPVPDMGLEGKSSDDIAALSSSIYNDSYGFTLYKYDALGRVTSITRPGKEWNENQKQIRVSYQLAGSDVKKYGADAKSFGYYKQGDLLCQTITDEDNHKISVFKDFRGLKVLERRYDGSTKFDTYYVYDEIGQLRFVLQPMYQSEASLDKFAFQYSYDGHGRVASKKLPGCQPVTYEYDGITDRVVKMQDGLLRAKGKFRTYEYDGLGRMTRQSISSGSMVEYDEIINYYDDYSFLTNNTMTCEGPVYYYLKKNSTGFHGQLTGTQQRASNGEELLTVYAYDDHGRIIRKGEIGLDGHLSVSESEYNFVGDIDKEDFTEYELDGNVYELKHEGHITNNFDIPHTKLPTSSVIHLYEDNEATQMTDTISNFVYDDFGHVIANNRSGTAGDMSYEYDNLHGWVTCIASAKNFEQRLYRETEGQNKRWNGSISAMTWKTDNSTLRRYDYTYDGQNRLTCADYTHFAANRSGNVSETARWIPMNDGDEGAECYSEQFQYDKNSNIKWLARWGYCSDIDGYDTSDVLDIEYNGNQKKSLVNSGFEADYYGSMQCVDGACEDVEYAYDGNGNLTRDDNKGQTYEYNLLGHPSKVNGKTYTIEYVYAPDGCKLRAVHKTYTSTNKKTVKTSTTTDYVNGYIFKNGKPSMFSFDGGYYSFDSQGKLNGCHYYIQDYQGNNREVVNASTNAIEQINHYYSYGGLMGVISTKPNTQQFKYGGKELDLSNGLNLYDFEARQYDPGALDFTSVDLLAENDYGVSPYVYCGGDPINYVDKSGLRKVGISSFGYIVLSEEDGKDYVSLYKADCIGKDKYTYNQDIAPFIVPSELRSSILSMETSQFKRPGAGKYSNFFVTRSPAVFRLFDWILKSGPLVEWRLDVYKNDNDLQFVIGTDHNDIPALGVSTFDNFTDEIIAENRAVSVHNHLFGENPTMGPSVIVNSSGTIIGGDVKNAAQSPKIKNFVAVPTEIGSYNLYVYSANYTKNGNIEYSVSPLNTQGGFSTKNIESWFGISISF